MGSDGNDVEVATGSNEDEIVITAGMSRFKKFMSFFGPGLLIATVYVDPGQIVVDMESGSVFQYRMLWALLFANGMGLMFQHLCSRLSIVTGRNMAVENRLEYPRNLRLFLWFTVELASIAADLGYVMGTATALTILTGMSLHWGVLLTGLDTFVALGVQAFGIRKVEALVGSLFGMVVVCYIMEVFYVKPSVLGVMDGMLPRLWHKNERYGYGDWLKLLCANLGAAVCPPNFFLQSALVRTRRTERSERGVMEAFEYNLYETSICLILATIVNAVMLILAAAHFYPDRVVSLAQGADMLNDVLGNSARFAFAIAMLCAGQSSSLTGVLSTQYILEGFFQINIPGYIVRLVTRAIAIIPAFIIVYAEGPDVAADLIEQAQVVVNFVVPFTVIPLTKFLCSEVKMGPYRLSPNLRLACWFCSAVAIFLNMLALWDFVNGLEDLPVVLRVALGSLVIGAYIYLSYYLAVRPVRIATAGLWDAAKDVSGTPGVGFFVSTGPPLSQMQVSVIVGVISVVVMFFGYLALGEAGSVKCLLDHVGVVVGEGCSIPQLQGRLSLSSPAPMAVTGIQESASMLSPPAVLEAAEALMGGQ
ncbi:hypothetical protein CYMTET_41983 [Cymbomonas tetramitiformis]|uniref:Natural resistance-associated macrophage protein n=1 Tax=Cymbomonas tetramitiformis TaxID=36881 RepID=A0AAE0C6Q4_9CHLO|nr:hypothetical protein CYMTET_41983 [Cymbomonas tetramitiformis]